MSVKSVKSLCPDRGKMSVRCHPLRVGWNCCQLGPTNRSMAAFCERTRKSGSLKRSCRAAIGIGPSIRNPALTRASLVITCTVVDAPREWPSIPILVRSNAPRSAGNWRCSTSGFLPALSAASVSSTNRTSATRTRSSSPTEASHCVSGFFKGPTTPCNGPSGAASRSRRAVHVRWGRGGGPDCEGRMIVLCSPMGWPLMSTPAVSTTKAATT
jgi:hypothetical protein